MKTEEIRKKFIEFFEEKKHKYASASPVIAANDPTLMFINAGMNQFKDVFLGTGTRDYTRAVNSQPCIRVSGKHNDLEEVGHDTYHHTLFEMLGNWSFGDYYKEEAIKWAWELLTDVYKIPKEKLYATVYRTDDEAAELWPKVTDIDPSKVLRFDEKDNFWEMGDTGPCGPCSEVHIDLGEGFCDKQHEEGHECAVNAGCARYIELWNLVFIQYNRGKDGKLTELPNKHVDTGAGLERLAAVMNSCRSNYEIDVFNDIIQKIAELSGVKYSQDEGIPHRVIADHIRTLTFSISDGVIPSNEGRGYVIRRILRRAVRYGRKLDMTKPFLYKIVPTVIEIMGESYPGLKKNMDYVAKVIKSEEDSFLTTLDKGIDLFNQLADKVKADKLKTIPGEEVFKLFDTYGFPLDLTCLMAKEIDLDVDTDGFNKEMEKQKQRARAASSFGSESDKKDIPIGGEAIIAKTPDEKIKMARHHTATHLLQAALQEVLGSHVSQAGSLVSPSRLRFDFNHFEALTSEETKKIEDLVNSKIMESIKLSKTEEKYEDAINMGAMALFGEKYGDKVTVVKISDFSVELCGGTHVDNTGQIGLFKIVSESAIAAGVRRIEAFVGQSAIEYIQKQETVVKSLQGTLKVSEDKLLAKVSDVIDQLKVKDKEIDKLQAEIVAKSTTDIFKEAINIDGNYILIKKLDNIDKKGLMTMADKFIGQTSGVITLGSVLDDKVVFISKASKDMTSKGINCGEIVKLGAGICKGGGGGSPVMAQAGGKDITKVDQAIDEIKQLVEQKLHG